MTQPPQPPKPPPEVLPLPFVPIQNPLYPYPSTITYPLVKKYNITISNVNGNLTNISDIYEDVLPKTAISQNRYTTLAERLVIASYFRSILIRKGNGEQINIDETAGNDYIRERFEINNLLSHINIMDINPYHFNRLTNNPYRTSPNNMIMFRSCYPIKFNYDTNNVSCAFDSIGAHIRIYSQSIFDLLASKNTYINKKYCDLWRDIIYYEFINKSIIKPKICPHFVSMYAYYTTINSSVNFKRLIELKKNYDDTAAVEPNNISIIRQKMLQIELNNSLIHNPFNIFINRSIPVLINQSYENNIISDNIRIKQAGIKAAIKQQEPSNRCIVAITEGNTYNILDWATKTYEIGQGAVKRQVMSGFHSVEVWTSIIFQLLVALYVMDSKGFAFNDLQLGTNIFIKDLETDQSNIGYWKYNIKGIDFYVPNYGFIVMIDTSFKDFKNEQVVINDNDHIKMQYKIYGNIYDDILDSNQDYYTKSWNDEAITNFDNIFNNPLDSVFRQHGGIQPDVKIFDLFRDINNLKPNYNAWLNNFNIPPPPPAGISPLDFGDIIIKFFTDYLHNRVGTPLRTDEISMLQYHNNNYIPGEMVARMVNPEYYVYAIYVSSIGNLCSIITVDHNNPQGLRVFDNITRDEIIKLNSKVEQVYKPNKRFADDELLETYIVN